MIKFHRLNSLVICASLFFSIRYIWGFAIRRWTHRNLTAELRLSRWLTTFIIVIVSFNELHQSWFKARSLYLIWFDRIKVPRLSLLFCSHELLLSFWNETIFAHIARIFSRAMVWPILRRLCLIFRCKTSLLFIKSEFFTNRCCLLTNFSLGDWKLLFQLDISLRCIANHWQIHISAILCSTLLQFLNIYHLRESWLGAIGLKLQLVSVLHFFVSNFNLFLSYLWLNQFIFGRKDNWYYIWRLYIHSKIL